MRKERLRISVKVKTVIVNILGCLLDRQLEMMVKLNDELTVKKYQEKQVERLCKLVREPVSKKHKELRNVVLEEIFQKGVLGSGVEIRTQKESSNQTIVTVIDEKSRTCICELTLQKTCGSNYHVESHQLF